MFYAYTDALTGLTGCKREVILTGCDRLTVDSSYKVASLYFV